MELAKDYNEISQSGEIGYVKNEDWVLYLLQSLLRRPRLFQPVSRESTEQGSQFR
jgi:hypothetical protein